MLDLVDQRSFMVETVLEPACGTGNFLIEALNRKLNNLNRKHLYDSRDYAKSLLQIVSTLYGVDIQEDNVKETRARLFETVLSVYRQKYHSDNQLLSNSVRFVLNHNIMVGNTLELKDNKGRPLKFAEWKMQPDGTILRRDYTMQEIMDDLKAGHHDRPVMPYSDARMLNILTHTLWFLPNVASCYAMKNLLTERQNTFYSDYHINVCAGTKAGIGLSALQPVEESMEEPLKSKSITLSCGKLTTGVTIRPWTGVFMLRNLSSPETYFQTAFRAQSPWTMKDDNGNVEILKEDCYILDFALDRALKEVSDYSCRLNVNESDPEKKVGEFINFLPILAYDGATMKPVSASEVLDIAIAGTSATLLARRWESALLVNVDNDTLRRLLANPDAIKALESIEGFRALNQDIQTIINRSEHVKKVKQTGEHLTDKEKKQLSDEEKEFKSKRKQIQEKLIKFATRIPIFMEHDRRCLLTVSKENIS